jgi:hypothetical protein
MAATCALKVYVADFTDQYLECVEKSNSGEPVSDLVRVQTYSQFLTVVKIYVLCQISDDLHYRASLNL